MNATRVLTMLLLASLSVVGLVSAAGVGVFSIDSGSSNVGQVVATTLSLDNTWQPQADDIQLTVTWDGDVLDYISTTWEGGRVGSATPIGTSTLVLKYADMMNKYPNGKVAIADINFKALTAGRSYLTITADHVRGHDGVSETDFTDLTPSAVAGATPFQVYPGAAPPGVTTPTQTPFGPPTTIPTRIPTSIPTKIPTTNMVAYPPSLILSPTPSFQGYSVTIEGSVGPGMPGSTITRINWNWGDGVIEDHPVPNTHSYPGIGPYTITVTAFQSDGQSTTKTMTVYVSSQTEPTPKGPSTLPPTPIRTEGPSSNPFYPVNTQPTVPPALPLPTVIQPSSPALVQPVAISPTAQPTFRFGKRYAVGDPGSFLGTRFGSGSPTTVTKGSRTVTGSGTVLKPGSRSYGVTPPKGQFVRWYPAARWAAGLK